MPKYTTITHRRQCTTDPTYVMAIHWSHWHCPEQTCFSSGLVLILRPMDPTRPPSHGSNDTRRGEAQRMYNHVQAPGESLKRNGLTVTAVNWHEAKELSRHLCNQRSVIWSFGMTIQFPPAGMGALPLLLQRCSPLALAVKKAKFVTSLLTHPLISTTDPAFHRTGTFLSRTS